MAEMGKVLGQIRFTGHDVCAVPFDIVVGTPVIVPEKTHRCASTALTIVPIKDISLLQSLYWHKIACANT